jgi:hypothetical protein
LFAACLLAASVAAGCASHGRAERAGRKIDNGVDRVDRGADRAADKVDRAVDELKN